MAINKEYNDIQLDVKFTQASTRANLVSEENISVSFGKISKYFADLHSQAFTGYTHPTYTAHSSGLYKITVDSKGHVSGTAAVTASDLPAHTHSNYVLKTGDTMSGNLTFAVADGSDTPGIVFKRGNFTDSTLDWKIYNSSGALMMDRTVAGDTETWQNKFKVDGEGIWYSGTKVSLVGHTHSQYLPKTTYEWNKEISFGNSGYLKIGSFPMYDTNITIDINATTSKTYHGTVVIATQNVSTTSMGSHKIHVYDDPTGNIAASLRIVWTSGSRNYNIYFVPQSWSKNFIHIRALGNYMDGATDICIAQTGTAPTTTSGLEPVNILSVTSTGDGNAVTKVEIDSDGNLAVTKGSTFSTSDHTHGNITNGGALQTTDITIASGDKLVVTDSSNSNKVARASISFDGSTATKCLTQKGTWETFLATHPTITKSADTTSTASPGHGETFTVVDSVTREANGHVTKINTKTVTLPADSNTDTKVTQSSSTTSDFRPLLLGKNNQTNPENLETTVTDQTYVTKHVFVQPSTGNLTLYNASGDSPSLIFRRGTMIDNTLEWRIQNVGGKLNFDRDKNESTETWENIFQLDPTNNKMYFKNTEVSLSGHTHNYAGSTTVGGAATNIATTVTNGVSVGSTYYGVIFAADPNTSGGYPARKNDDFKYGHVDGTASSAGYAEIILGNNKDSTTAGNKRGVLTLYSKGTSYHSIETTETSTSVKHTLPATTGTILNSGTTSFTQTLSSGTKIGTIKINGTSTDLYCETNTNTDTKVTQTNTTTSADYRVLLSGNANDTTETTTGRKSVNLRFNPSSGGLYSFGFLWTDITGLTLDINTLTLSNGTLHSRRFIEKTDGGAANITNIPVTGHPFLLEVDLIRWASTTDYITRQRFTNAVNGTYSYVRYCTSGTWGSWTTRKYTDTDTKVTSSANHYTPATASGGDISKSASGATVEWGIDVVKGVTLNTDGKGHVTGISVTSGKIPENPVPSNNVTGSGTSGYLTKWNGTNTVTNGPQLGSSTTTFLRNDGTWATPPGTYTHPTYTRTDTTSTASPTHGGTFTAIDSVTSTNGHVTAVNVKTVTLPAQYVHPGKTQTDTTSTTSPAHGGTFTVVDSVTRDTYGHVSGINVKTVTLPSDQNTDTKVKVTANTTTKGYLIASTTSPNGTAVEGIADTGVYLDTTAGGLCATNVKASSTVCANTANSTSAGGIALYSTDPETYGIMFRGTSNSGKHGYVQSDWATYFTMNQGATTRGWVFRKKTDGPVASISGAGNAVFNGSVTVGGNTTNTSGCRMEYNTSTQSLDFVFA